MRIVIAAAALLAATGLAAAQDSEAQEPGAEGSMEATASFIDAEGNDAGAATLTDTPHGVLIELGASGLPEGMWVGFHIHENGVCEAEGGFETAGGHFNPADAEHGYKAEGGPHAGDMPNQHVADDGSLQAHVFNPWVRLDEGDAPIRGKALMIHGHADDYASQPSGDAGDRIACAVIE